MGDPEVDMPMQMAREMRSPWRKDRKVGAAPTRRDEERAATGYLTTGAVARRLDVSEQTVVNWVAAGKLRATVTGGGHRRIPVEDVEALAPTLPNARPLPRGRVPGGGR